MGKRKDKKKAKKAKEKSLSAGTHLEQNANMKHKDFPLFLRANFEEAGERINQ